MGRYYLTTAIDYSNGDPHLGHALEKVGADCIARYRRLRGDQVHFLMGMDEHSQSVIAAAERGGVTPRAWVDDMAERFERFWSRLECSNDDWIRTTEPRHVAGVTALLERIREKNPGDLFEGEYEGLYCTGCEEFKTEAQIVDGHCIEHPTLDLVKTKERNWFFRLSRYQDVMKQKITSGEYRVDPEFRRNEVLRLIEDGLQDISISRQRMPWGIPFPGDRAADGLRLVRRADQLPLGHGISRAGIREALARGPARRRQGDHAIPLHHLARDAAGRGYRAAEAGVGARLRAVGRRQDVEDRGHRGRVSRPRSRGTAPDALRYYLLRDIGFWNDGDFTWERFDARYISDLADGLGNLASRSLAMIVRYREGVIPSGPATSLDESAAAVVDQIRRCARRRVRFRQGARRRVGPRERRQSVHRAARAMGAREGREGCGAR